MIQKEILFFYEKYLCLCNVLSMKILSVKRPVYEMTHIELKKSYFRCRMEESSRKTDNSAENIVRQAEIHFKLDCPRIKYYLLFECSL